ncbi:F-box/kelch-repeat protein SKIP6 isoform X2 [Spinacia oleracea]|uniref:F-box/kelch-repeat protein SKIP6 isoform X2 n=2 Tax=Spinacia oleracea TaxID=3562 RepID=A0A9R0IDW8_SPIOL|nr:F-box/kelch-repeat protein SKIP6 isoform X2 [Spinacia oleracea]
MADQSSSSSSDPTETHHHDQTLIPALSNDVALQCLARIPRFHHPLLSLVSKSWRSALQSPLFHATRLALNTTQSFLFLNLRLFNPKDSSFSFKWYSLQPCTLDPQITLIPRILIPMNSSPCHLIGASFVSIGRHLYVIGGSVNDIPSPNMWVFDCLTNKWEMGPKMRVGREFAASGVINGKIYVLGGCVVDNWARSINWAEMFDPVTGSWRAIPSPIEVREKWMHASAVVGGRIYAMADRSGVIFDPELGEWSSVSTELDMGWRGRAAVVDEVLYCYDYLGKIRGFDVGENEWKELKGVDKHLPKFLCGATMANVGGRLFVVWEGKGKGKANIEVLCAEILVRKNESGELWGSIVWSDVIILIPKGSSIVHCLDVHLHFKVK